MTQSVCCIDGQSRRFDCATVAEKRDLFEQLYGWLRSLPSEDELRRVVRDLCGRYQVDIAAFCNELCMSWDELATLAADPLVTIGAHTVNHVMLAKVPETQARTEMDMSRTVIEAALGMPAGTSLLSGRRPDLGGAARVPDRRRARFQDRRHDAAGRAVCRHTAII